MASDSFDVSDVTESANEEVYLRDLRHIVHDRQAYVGGR